MMNKEAFTRFIETLLNEHSLSVEHNSGQSTTYEIKGDAKALATDVFSADDCYLGITRHIFLGGFQMQRSFDDVQGCLAVDVVNNTKQVRHLVPWDTENHAGVMGA